MRAVISGELTLIRGRHQGILTSHGEGSGQAEWSAGMVELGIRITECAPVSASQSVLLCSPLYTCRTVVSISD